MFATICIIALMVLPFEANWAYPESTDEEFLKSARLWTEGKISDTIFLDSMKTMFDNHTLVGYKNPPNVFLLPHSGNLSVSISGTVEETSRRGTVFLEVTYPDQTVFKTSALILNTGRYETKIVFDNNAELGTYRINASFEGKNFEPSYFTFIRNTREIPEWFKEPTTWWIEGITSDSEYLNAIQYLINQRIIIDDSRTWLTKQLEPLLIKVSGQQMIRRGTTQTITVQVLSEGIPVDSAQVFVRVENYDEEVLKEFNGYTNQGIYVVSWEIDKSINNYTTFLVFIDVTDDCSSVTKVFKFVAYCLPGEKNCKIRGN